jgi:hypothetical protein
MRGMTVQRKNNELVRFRGPVYGIQLCQQQLNQSTQPAVEASSWKQLLN